MFSISRKEKFNILASFSLSTDDMRTLALLYQPIIGPEAFSMYLTLTSLISRDALESRDYKHSFLLDLVNINEAKFLELRRILEAIGLMITYKNDEGYLYVLAAPLTPKSFINDGTIGLYLFSSVGEEMFYQIKDLFKIKKINKDSYKNISASLDDVFESVIVTTNLNKDGNLVVDKKANKSVKFKNQEFDIDEFIKNINVEFLPAGVSEKFKSLIINTASTYGFDEGDMAALFTESIGSDCLFSYQILKKKAKVLYQFKNGEVLPNLKVKQSAKEDKYLDEIINLSSEEFLSSVLGDAFTRKALDTMLELNNTLPFDANVIRIMIIYVIKMIKNKDEGELMMPPISYFKKVSDDWILNGISDIYDAYNKYILHINDDKPVVKKSRPTKVAKPKSYSKENNDKDVRDMMEGL